MGAITFQAGAADAAKRLDHFLQEKLPGYSRSRVQDWIKAGRVRVDGVAAAKASMALRGGESVEVEPAELAPLRAFAEDIPISVLYEDAAVIAVDKAAGMVVHLGAGNHEGTLVNALLHRFGTLSKSNGDERPGIVHRLDRDTSGVLLVARTPGSAAFFSKRFSGRSAKKIYWALVVGVPDVAEGMIDAPLAKQPGTGGEKMHVDTEGGQPARTRYRVIDRAGNRAAWVELQPLTGRTHQLRVHLAAIGHPIVGDGKYGGQDAFLTGSISRKMHLHARRLIIDAPGGGTLDATAELPEHFAASMEQLGFDQGASAAEPEKGPPPPSRVEKKQAAKAHAKTYRKARRGERRSRTLGAPRSKPKGGKR